MDDIAGGCSEEMAMQKPCEAGTVTLGTSLKLKRDRLARQLAEIDEAIAGLAAHPEVETVLNQLAKVNRY